MGHDEHQMEEEHEQREEPRLSFSEKFLEGLFNNWGKITSYGVGTAFGIILLNLFIGIVGRGADESLKTAQVQRETSVQNAESYKSVANSMVTVSESMAKLSALSESTKNIQKQIMDESREFQKESRVYQEKNLGQQKQILDQLVTQGTMLSESATLHNRQLSAIEDNCKKLDGLKTDSDERNRTQTKKLDDILKGLEKRKP